jgi:hypothetical protein
MREKSSESGMFSIFRPLYLPERNDGSAQGCGRRPDTAASGQKQGGGRRGSERARLRRTAGDDTLSRDDAGHGANRENRNFPSTSKELTQDFGRLA